MKIAGFTFGKKHLIILGVLILAIFVISRCSSSAEDAKRQQLLEEDMNNDDTGIEDVNNNSSQDRDEEGNLIFTDEELELLQTYDLEQQGYIKSLGFPPEGYIWSEEGTLVAVSSDELTAEDVIYGYLRNLSMLDFSTAGRYVSSSTLISAYKGYYEDIDTSAVMDFKRKMLKLIIKSIEVDGLGDISIFEDGTEYVTVYVKCLDIRDKEFWLEDKDTIFTNLYKLASTEQDSNKMQIYLYDYIYNKFESGVVEKKSYSIELVLKKARGKGWLLANDTALYNVVVDPEGNSINSFILDEYTKYVESLEN